MKLLLSISIFLMFFCVHAKAQTYLIEDKIYSAKFQGPYVEFLYDVQDIDKAYKDYLENKNIKKLEKIERKYSTAPVWYAFTVKNTFNEQLERIIQFPFGCTDEMELYVLNNTTKSFEKIHRKHTTPLDQREYEIRRLSAGLNFAPFEEKLIIAKLKSFHQVSVGFDIYSTKKAYEYEKNYKTIALLYCGVAIGLFLYNLFIAATSRKKEIFAYVGLLFCLSTLIVFIADIPAYFGIVLPVFFHQTLPIHSALVVVSMNLFTMGFLKTKSTTPKLHKAMIISTSLAVLGGGLSFINATYNLASVIINNLTTIMLVVSLVSSAYISYKSKSRPALLFTIATSSLFVSGLIYMLTWSFGLIPRNFMTANVILLGSAIEMILFSLAIADSFKKEIYDEFKQRQQAEIELKQLNLVLENKVKEKSNQLIQTQKRAALGEMASAIAHEINSPLSAVFNNLQFLQNLMSKNKIDVKKFNDLNLKTQRIINEVFELTGQLKTFGSSYDHYSKELFVLEDIILPIRIKVEEMSAHHRLDVEGVEEIQIETMRYPLFIVISNLVKVVALLNERTQIKFESTYGNRLEISINAFNRNIPQSILSYLENPFNEQEGADKGSGLEFSLAKDALEVLEGSLDIGDKKDNYIFKIILTAKIVQSKQVA